MADGVTITIPQMPAFIRAVLAVPAEEAKAVRRAMGSGLQRIRKNFIRTQLHGPPGIKATGRLSKGKNIFTHVEGTRASNVEGKIGISRILHVHEVGLTIFPKKHSLLFLHAKGGSKMPIFGVARQVHIPARLRFRQEVRAESSQIIRDVKSATFDTTKHTLQKGLLKST